MPNQTVDPMIIKTKIEIKDVYDLRLDSKIRKIVLYTILDYICLFLLVLMVLLFMDTPGSNNIPENGVQGINTPIDDAPESKPYSSVIVFVSVVLFGIFGYRWMSKRDARKHYNSNKMLQKEFTYTILPIQ